MFRKIGFSTRITILLFILVGLLLVYNSAVGAGETWWDKSERRLYQDEGPGGGTNAEDSYNLQRERRDRARERSMNPC